MKRRQFVKKSTLTYLATLLGTEIVFGNVMPIAYTPLALREPDPFELFNKDREMKILNDKPRNIESKPHLLNDAVTPNKYMFIRNNGHIPEKIDEEQWSVLFDGKSVIKETTFSLKELKENFKHYTYQLTLECGGNGRSEFNPPAKGNQWSTGAVSCAKWTGVRLRDVLNAVGVKEDAIYIGYHAADTHLSGDALKEPISRGVPMQKAYQEETLLAFAMNDKPIPLAHGFPLRLVAGGWPASASGKWINRISVRNMVHNGAKMGGYSYRVPRNPVEPGTLVKEYDMRIIESMPVKSLITYPKSGALLNLGDSLAINGHAWAGEQEVMTMEYSIDFGTTWSEAKLKKPVNRLAWQQFSAIVKFPRKGYYEVWAKATDATGDSQPMVVPGWNPKGYLNNACHRIAVKVS